jgi:uridine phosphorylase
MDLKSSSELILNNDHSVYHLNLCNEDLNDTIITVGDPDRVNKFKKYFDKITCDKSNREFRVLSGTSAGKAFTVLSTGIGTDNIDIVLNELNLLSKVDLRKRELKKEAQLLKIIRVGTSGTFSEEVELGTYLSSEYAIGLEGLMHYYPFQKNNEELELESSVNTHIKRNFPFINAYAIKASSNLVDTLSNICQNGITATCQGFYHPQGRFIFQKPVPSVLDTLREIKWHDRVLTNFEMETAGILGLAKYFEFEACSVSLILANRIKNEFLSNADEAMNMMIDKVWEELRSA